MGVGELHVVALAAAAVDLDGELIELAAVTIVDSYDDGGRQVLEHPAHGIAEFIGIHLGRRAAVNAGLEVGGGRTYAAEDVAPAVIAEAHDVLHALRIHPFAAPGFSVDLVVLLRKVEAVGVGQLQRVPGFVAERAVPGHVENAGGECLADPVIGGVVKGAHGAALVEEELRRAVGAVGRIDTCVLRILTPQVIDSVAVYDAVGRQD